MVFFPAPPPIGQPPLCEAYRRRQYYEAQATYCEALAEFLIKGGLFFPAKTPDAPSTIVRGHSIYTYWPPESALRQKVKALALTLGCEHPSPTVGRLCRWLVSDFLELPHKGTAWAKSYQSLAHKGSHWHYLYVDTRDSYFGVEVDLKSAYFASYLKGSSLLYSPRHGYLPDGLAKDKLVAFLELIPKWFRLSLLGVLAGHQLKFCAKADVPGDTPVLLYRSIPRISYGAAFNAAHRAILRNYKILQKIHYLGGEWIRRIHTDSFFLDAYCPDSVERRIFDYLLEKNSEYTVKGVGNAYFWDVNTGIIGRKYVGAKAEVKRRDAEKPHPRESRGKVSTLVERFPHLAGQIKSYLSQFEEKKPEPRQLTLFTLSDHAVARSSYEFH